MRRALHACLRVVTALAVTGVGGVAQDIEAVAGARGLPLPAAYYAQIAENPDAYRFARALFRRGAPAQAATEGPVRLPVVLALFSDSPVPHVTREMVRQAVFDGPSSTGTLTDAYDEMSGGALAVTGDVHGWVRTSHSMAAVVGASNGLGNDGTVGPYFVEALDSLDAAIDFSLYDSDGPDGVPNSGDDDGYVDVITFEYLEVSGSCGGPAIWPHRWTIAARTGAPFTTDDIGADGTPILIDDYITQSASDCTGLGVQDASTMAHELGHALGLPDYYHWIDRSAGPRGRRWVLGCWGLMAAGSWGCGPVVEPPAVFGPTHLTAHSKHMLGWLDYRPLGEVWNQEVLLDPVQTSLEALRVPLDEDGDEYLIAEYRGRTGFDAQLPAAGVVLYKLDLGASLRPNPASGSPYRLRLLERDDNDGLLRTDFEGGNRGEAGDAWGVGGSVHRLHASTGPALTLSDGGATTVTVHEVSVDQGRARLVVSTSPQPRLVPPQGTFDASQVVDFVQGVRVAGGAMPYTVMGTAPGGLSISALGDGLTATGSAADTTRLFLWVRDARGRASDPLVLGSAASAEWSVELVDLLGPFLDPDATTLASEERVFLDQAGNGNGVYDVGDLRRWLNGRPAP